MNGLFEFASKLSGASFATILLFVILVIVITSRRGDWVWKREVAAKDELIAELKNDRDKWKELALARRDDVENAVIDIARRRRS